jgi:folate-binding protein YgfZ
MTSRAVLTDRAILAIAGDEARAFLQGLITNDIRGLTPDAALHAALLTPQGKILFDFLLYDAGSQILVDCPRADAEGLRKRLLLYRLRAKLDIAARDDLAVLAHWDGAEPSAPAWRDPRHPLLGWRSAVGANSVAADGASEAAFLAHRLDLGIPEGADFGHDAMFALDAGLEELHGVAFDKGCYIGQELTARMKHRGTARKRLLAIEGESLLPPPPTPITAEGREIGSLASIYGTRGFALLRLDRLAETDAAALAAAGVHVHVRAPASLPA